MATPRQFTGSLWEMAYLVRWFIKDGDFPVRNPLRRPVVLTTEIQDLAELTKTVWDWIVDGHMFQTFKCLKHHAPKMTRIVAPSNPGLQLFSWACRIINWNDTPTISCSINPAPKVHPNTWAIGVPCHGTTQPQSSLSWVHPDIVRLISKYATSIHKYPTSSSNLLQYLMVSIHIYPMNPTHMTGSVFVKHRGSKTAGPKRWHLWWHRCGFGLAAMSSQGLKVLVWKGPYGPRKTGWIL